MNRRRRAEKALVMTALVGVGLLNLAPGIALVRPDRLLALYGVSGLDANLEVLLRHRAFLLAAVGIFMLVAALRSNWRRSGLLIGLASSVVYLALALTAPVNAEITRVAWVDLAVLPLLLAGLACVGRRVPAVVAEPSDV